MMRPASRMNSPVSYDQFMGFMHGLIWVLLFIGFIVNVVIAVDHDTIDPVHAYRSLLFLGLLIFLDGRRKR